MPEPRSVVTSFLWGLAIGLLVVLAVLCSGCAASWRAARTPGGKATSATSTLPATLTAPANPSAATTQTTTTRTVYAEPAQAAPATTTTPAHPQPWPLLQETTTSTTLGPSQDVAGILDQLGGYAQYLPAILVGLGLVGAAFLAYRHEHYVIAAMLASGGAACLITGILWIGPAAVIIAVLLYLAWKSGAVRLPIP